MKFKIKDILPNPFRNIETYPINREKVEELKRSMDRTDYWGNIVGRLSYGKPEIAYGHHRRVALKEKYGNEHMIDIIIRDLQDDDMIHIMASENMDVWASRAIVDIETIHAVVKAYAEGKISLPRVDKSTRQKTWRCAPSFVPGDVSGNTAYLYTGQEIGEFLGWVQPNGRRSEKIDTCLTALQYIEEGVLTLAEFEKLNTSQMGAVIEQTRNAREHLELIAKSQDRNVERFKEEESQAQTDKDRLRAAQRREMAELSAIEHRQQARETAKTVANSLSAGFSSGSLATKQAATEAYKLRPKLNGAPPHIEDALRKILKVVGNFLRNGSDENAVRLDEIIAYKQYLTETTCRDAAATLRQLAERVNSAADLFESKN